VTVGKNAVRSKLRPDTCLCRAASTLLKAELQRWQTRPTESKLIHVTREEIDVPDPAELAEEVLHVSHANVHGKISDCERQRHIY